MRKRPQALQNALELHEKWIYGTPPHSFNKADLRRMDFRGVNLSGADMSEANLLEANLFRANCYMTDFRNANLQGAYMACAILCYANFEGAQLEGVDIFKAKISERDVERFVKAGADVGFAIIVRIATADDVLKEKTDSKRAEFAWNHTKKKEW